MNRKIDILRGELHCELTSNILPYWIDNMVDNERSGFYGRIDGEGRLHRDAPKGAILCARLLWSFSAAYRILGRSEYLDMASRAKDFLLGSLLDPIYGGVYWSSDASGATLDSKKQIYAQGFAIYALSEYYRATGDRQALSRAIELFRLVEKHSYDSVNGGYAEAFAREWGEIEDMRLSEKDANERKTMNTHLHILEPYTALYRVWPNEQLGKQLRTLIDIFLSRIVDADTHHLNLFFDDEWRSKSSIVSYGHDIESSWLLHEAALVLGDGQLLARVEPYVKAIAEAAAEGLTANGGMIYERESATATPDGDYHWWVQAETIIGYLNLYQHFGDEKALSRALQCWEFVKSSIIDREGGEWRWSLLADGEPNREDDKAGFWKCPYHNSRLCLEVIERFSV